jgi:recombination protein RecT
MNTNNETSAKDLAIAKVERMKVALTEDFVQNQLRAALAENSSAFAASVIDLYTGDKSLMECDPKQVIMQAMKAAILRLPVVKSLGYAWIVAYKGIPQFQIGYKGLIQLAIRTGEYRIIHTDVVYEGEYRTVNKLTGEFDFSGPKVSEKVVGFFAHFELKNGFSKTLYMTREQVDAHAKKYSKSYSFNGSPWKTEFDAMAMKTVLSGLLRKWGYLSVEMVNAMESDEDQDTADRVVNEIRGNANKTSAGFEDAETVEHTQNNGQASAPF